MKKILFGIPFVISVIGIIIYVAFNYLETLAFVKNLTNNTPYKIVTHFACSDYCPNKKSSYMKLIYEGVSQEDICNSIDGTIFIYYGWGETKICEI